MVNREGDEAAFPLVCGNFGVQSGMTLRDYFAAKAMAAIISKIPATMVEDRQAIPKCVSQGAYDYADAMLKERAVERAA